MNLFAAGVSPSQINLSWSGLDSSASVSLQRSSAGGPPVEIATINPWMTGYTDSGLLAGTTYFYRLVETVIAIASATTQSGTPPSGWTRLISGPNDDEAKGVAMDAAGNVVAVGYFSGTANFGPRSITAVGPQDVFTVKYDPAGNLLWASTFGGTGMCVLTSVAIDNSGNVVAVGFFAGTITVGSVTLSSLGGNDWLIVKLNGTTGVPLFAKRLGGGGDDYARGVATDPNNGDIVVVGEFSRGVTIDGTLFIASTLGSQDSLIVRYKSDGTLIWARHWVCGSYDSANGVAINWLGSVIVCGTFLGNIDFGDGHGPKQVNVGNPFSDFYVAKLSPTGAVVWGRVFGSTGPDVAYSVAVDFNQDVIVTGAFGSPMDMSGGIQPPLASTAQQNAFLAKLSGADGIHLWSKAFPHPQNAPQIGQAVAVDGGSIILAGSFQGTSDFGSGVLTSAGGWDAFVASFTTSGSPIASSRIGGAASDFAYGVSAKGGTVVCGVTAGDAFVTRL